MDLRYHKNHAKWFVTPVIRAIRKYALIEEGDRVCVGLSGGKDSITLLYILRYLQRYSHLTYELSAIHIRTSPDYDTTLLRDYCDALGSPTLKRLSNCQAMLLQRRRVPSALGSGEERRHGLWRKGGLGSSPMVTTPMMRPRPCS